MILLHAAVLVLTAGLAACSTIGPLPASRANQPAPIGAPGAPSEWTAGLSESNRLSGSECNPPPDSSRTQSIVGYGSLMQDESRKRIAPRTGTAYPVAVKGFRRGWFTRGGKIGYDTTYLGVVEDKNSRMNAVIYQVDEAEIYETDKRESSYCRQSVDAAQLMALAAEAPALTGQIWIYVSKPERIATPDRRYPIVQSYVDVFVAGCLEQEQRFRIEGFTRQCLTTTTDWSDHWVNDRIYPRRPFIYQPKARQIDKLLSEGLPEYFPRIRIESGQ